MRKTTIAVLCLVFALSGVALADNPMEGGIGGQTGGGTCSTCKTNVWGDEGVCERNAAGDWADCKGGSICYWDGLQGWECSPYCGHDRCYYV